MATLTTCACMHKIYLILRNNKQNGPYSLEELVQLNLKPHDLIWVEGRSAGWRYPTEIEALKTFVSGAVAEPAAQKSVQMPTEPAVAPIRTISTDDAVAVKQASKLSKHIYISLPGGNIAPTAPVSQADALEESPEAKLERRAQELQQRIQAFAQKQQDKPKEETETKYARSLDDLRQDYADWLHRKNKKKGFSVNKSQLTIAAAVLFLVLSGFAITRFVSGNTNENEAVTEDIKLQPVTANAAFPEKTDDNGFQNAATIETPKTGVPEQLDPHSLSAEEEAIVDNYLASLERTLLEDSKNQVPPRAASGAGKKAASRAKSGKKATGQKDPLIQQQVFSEPEIQQASQPERKSVPLPELINLNGKYKYDDSRRHITGLEVTIQNNSDQLLKRVAVDVFYYKKKERLFEKETLYFHNVHPQNSLTLATSGNKKAVSARFQLGLVTTD